MYLPAPVLQQARVRRLLDEAVAEPILACRASALLDDQVEPLELGQCRPQPLAWHEPLEQRHSEAASDDGGERRDLAHVGRETVESRLQGLLERGGDERSVAALNSV